jgi:hypothetical protein
MGYTFVDLSSSSLLAFGRLTALTEDPGGTLQSTTYYRYRVQHDLLALCQRGVFSGTTSIHLPQCLRSYRAYPLANSSTLAAYDFYQQSAKHLLSGAIRYLHFADAIKTNRSVFRKSRSSVSSPQFCSFAKAYPKQSP